MDRAEATKFVAEWERAWNARDLDSLLGHFSDAVVFTSPVAAQILPDCDGVIRGKEALRRYWAEGLRRIPDLRFEVESVYAGVRTIVINYRNQAGGCVCEALTFDGPFVVAGDATYPSDDAARASGAASR
ncbi:MAG: YybH family protein [Solirubrobacteraceae bacterium]